MVNLFCKLICPVFSNSTLNSKKAKFTIKTKPIIINIARARKLLFSIN